jgi:hypothetical protein
MTFQNGFGPFRWLGQPSVGAPGPLKASNKTVFVVLANE